jgi:hypothetical protein
LIFYDCELTVSDNGFVFGQTALEAARTPGAGQEKLNPLAGNDFVRG